MLIIRSFFLFFLTQITVLAAPIPLNGISLNALARSLKDDDALLSRTNLEGNQNPLASRTFTIDYVCLVYLMASIPATIGLRIPHTNGNFLIPYVMSLLFLMCYNLIMQRRYVSLDHLTDSSTLAHIVVMSLPKIGIYLLDSVWKQMLNSSSHLQGNLILILLPLNMMILPLNLKVLPLNIKVLPLNIKLLPLNLTHINFKQKLCLMQVCYLLDSG